MAIVIPQTGFGGTVRSRRGGVDQDRGGSEAGGKDEGGRRGVEFDVAGSWVVVWSWRYT